jgi:hypothetical protein
MANLLVEDRRFPASVHWKTLRPGWPVLVLVQRVLPQPQRVPVPLELRVQLRF